jgi:phospholipid/cholesterol/gamma-HCH transport system ATP-binding protein
MIRFDRVSKAFGEKKILYDVSFELLNGEIAFLIGKSGTGKSVTLKQVVGLIEPDQGEIHVKGKALSQLNENEWVRHRRECAYIFQHPTLIDEFTIGENLRLGLESVSNKKVFEKLAAVGFRFNENNEGSFLLRYPNDLSYGEKKRLSIARALLLNPSCILFDEPTTGLDPIMTKAIHVLIHKLSRKLGVTSLVVSHDMVSALEVADRILLLDQGRLVENASPNQLRKSEDGLTKRFFGEPA